MTTDSALPPSTPKDVRIGATDPADVAFPLRWGIIGAGRISAQWVMCLHACAGATVTAVASRSEDRAREFARKYGIASAYGSYAEMVTSPDVDIVYVGTINRLHKEHSIVEYGPEKCAVLTFPAMPSEFVETTELVGRAGRITLEQPAHAPTTITLRIPPPGTVPSRYVTDNIPAPAQRFEYPLPAAVSFPERAYPNQQGFLYQAEAVHRCLAAGLRQCPQYDKQESLHALDIVAEINAQLAAG